MTDADRILDLIINTTADITLWVLGLVSLSAIEPREPRPS